MKVLVTGGCGYIGSHIAVELLENDYEVVVIDNLSNSNENVIKNIEKITGKKIIFYKNDVKDKFALRNIFINHKIDAVIHLAGFKAVGESVKLPLKYYDNNLISLINLLEIMQENHCKKIVFSSSATVYGKTAKLPFKEESILKAENPYGNTKLVNESILGDLSKSDSEWSIVVLRYFNPIGAHSSGLIGESINGEPNNLMPYIQKVAIGKAPFLKVYGSDYETPDGTGVRDYIHVVDLAQGHLKALDSILSDKNNGINYYNLGTGKGNSVLEVVKAFEKVNNVKVNYKIVERRDGDIAEAYADTLLSREKLNWEPKYGIEEMCKDSFNFVMKQKDIDINSF